MNVFKKKQREFPEVGKGIKPIKTESTFTQMYKLKNVDNLTFFKYLTILSFIAMAGCFCLIYTAYRTESNLHVLIATVGAAPLILQSLYLLIISMTNKWFIDKNWLQKPFFKTRYTKSQILLIVLFILFIMGNGGTSRFEASNIMFMSMLTITALAFYDTQNIALGIMLNSILKLFEFLILVSNIPFAVALTIITILPFLFYIMYRKALKRDGTSK